MDRSAPTLFRTNLFQVLKLVVSVTSSVGFPTLCPLGGLEIFSPKKMGFETEIKGLGVSEIGLPTSLLSVLSAVVKLSSTSLGPSVTPDLKVWEAVNSGFTISKGFERLDSGGNSITCSVISGFSVMGCSTITSWVTEITPPWMVAWGVEDACLPSVPGAN
ncbi:hypothetical protein ACB092_02G183800 [Castanea dentata]